MDSHINSRSRWRIRQTLALTFSIVLGLVAAKSVAAQDAVCQNCGYTWQSPVALPGGPYTGLTGQSIQLNGWDSYSYEGWITDYYWDFGDGTWGSGPNPNHQYNADGVYTMWLTVCDDVGYCASSQGFVTVDSVNLPVRITFDELPNNTVVADQYLNQYGVRFYSGNFFYPTHTYQNCGFCSTTSPPNFLSTKPDDSGQVIVEFTQPVSNLTFYIIGVDSFFNQFAVLDVYRNGALYATYPIYGNGTFTVGLTLGSLTAISKIVVRGITDPAGIGFDDFTFSVPSDIKITNGRVSGYLNGTTQNALLGADVAFNATPLPSGFAGGTYAWTFTGSPALLTAANQSSVAVRWTQTGTYRATVAYTKGSSSTTGFVDVNVIIPTLTSFSATEFSDQLNRDRNCSNQPAGVVYSLGCFQQGGPEDGIIWTATSQIPSGSYLSDPARSGIKFVQAASVYRKRLRDGNTQCFTARSSQSDVGSGWQLDNVDPYNHIPQHPPLYFSQGNTVVMSDLDAPSSLIEGTINNVFFSEDARLISDNFETYVFYFTTDPLNPEPAHPIFQQPMGLQGSAFPYARLAWSWGGQARFNYFSVPQNLLFTLQFTNTTAGQVNASGTNTIASLATNVNTLTFNTCPGTTATSNPIDGSRFYTNQLYLDFLNRSADQSGLNFWRSNITYCAFDPTCIGNKRVDVARAFFYSGEFIGMHPELGGQRGTHEYNSSFVYWCYRGFLRREPNDPPDNNWNGFNFWVGVLDSTNPDAGDYKYNQMLRAFIVSIEYRGRFGQP